MQSQIMRPVCRRADDRYCIATPTVRGQFELRTYSVLVALSFLAGLWLTGKEAVRKGLDPALISEFSLYALIGGIVGARIYFVAFSDPLHYLGKPWEIFAMWHGGIGIIGALGGGFLAAVWFCRKKRIPLLKFADVLAPAAALGQTLGQFACLANGDAYGRPTDLPWASRIPIRVRLRR